MVYYILCDGEVEQFTTEDDAIKRVDELKEFGVPINILASLSNVDEQGNHNATELGKLYIHYVEGKVYGFNYTRPEDN